MRTALLLGLLLTTAAQATGSVTCESTTGKDRRVIRWGATRAIGSPLLGAVHVDEKPVKGHVVGYWVDPASRILLRVTDEQLLRTVVLLDVVKEEKGLVGEAYVQLGEKDPGRKLGVRCELE